MDIFRGAIFVFLPTVIRPNIGTKGHSPFLLPLLLLANNVFVIENRNPANIQES